MQNLLLQKPQRPIRGERSYRSSESVSIFAPSPFNALLNLSARLRSEKGKVVVADRTALGSRNERDRLGDLGGTEIPTTVFKLCSRSGFKVKQRE